MTMKCPKCKSEIRDDALFCSECGTKIEKETTMNSRVAKREQQKQSQNKKTVTIVAIVALVVIIVIGCYFLFFKGDQSSEEKQTTTEKTETTTKKIKLKKTKLTIKVGETEYIEANMDCQYKVKDTSICEVDSFGTVKGLKEGTTTVTCTADNKTQATCQITVQKENKIEIESYEASSTLLAENYDYSVKNVFDQNYKTCWVEGAEDDGLGQSITVHFKNKVKINQLFIVNGISKTNELYLKNNRLKQAILTFDDGSQEIINVNDIYNQKQELSFTARETKSVTIAIKEVYRGSKYQDTCISELGYSYK